MKQPDTSDNLDHIDPADTVGQLLNMQRGLGKRLGIPNDPLRVGVALGVEVSELIEAIGGWRWWNTHKEQDRAAAQEELIDVLHFTLALCLQLGLDTPQKLMAAYKEKHIKNWTRAADPGGGV